MVSKFYRETHSVGLIFIARCGLPFFRYAFVSTILCHMVATSRSTGCQLARYMELSSAATVWNKPTCTRTALACLGYQPCELPLLPIASTNLVIGSLRSHKLQPHRRVANSFCVLDSCSRVSGSLSGTSTKSSSKASISSSSAIL